MELPVPQMSLESLPMFRQIDKLHQNRLTPGSVPWLLAHQREWFPLWLFTQWRGQGRRGRPAWPAVLLLTLLILRWTEQGHSRRSACEKRVADDMSWRGAMKLPIHIMGPNEKTVREFEGYLQDRDGRSGLPRYLLLAEHIVRVCQHKGVMDSPPQFAMDSTPMWCYGAVKDTVRLMGEGLCRLGNLWAAAMGISRVELAQQWQMPLLLAPSVKGHWSIDWSESAAVAQVVDSLAHTVVQTLARVRRNLVAVPRSVDRKRLLRACRHLCRVLEDNLETDKQGRLVIAERVAKDRLLSLTDPQARHGHKSRSRTFDGFKLHLVGDVVSGLLLSLCVTAGNEHDSRPAPRLVRRAQRICQSMEQLLCDTAYGGARLRVLIRGTTGVELLAPPPPDTHPKLGRLGKRHLTLNLSQNQATCAAGVTSSDMRWVESAEAGMHVRKFKWPKAVCDGCHLSAACRGSQRGGHTVLLHPYEEELRRARQNFSQPAVQQLYRLRTQGERLINQVVRHGGRKARAFGLAAANLQAHLIALADNLRLLAQRLGRFP